MAGVCEKVNVEYQAFDLNLEFLKYTNQDIWDQVFLHISVGKNLVELSPYLLDLVDQFLDHVVADINNYSPDCVAITLLTYVQQQWAERFLSRLRPAFSGMVIAGGPGVCVPNVANKFSTTTFGEDLVKEKLLDYYVLGEGDLILEEFFLGNRNLPGLNHAKVHGIWQPQLDDLDAFAIRSYKHISFDGYNVYDDKTHRVSITGSRGCVRRCTFCDVGHMWKKYRYRSGEKIANEILKHHHDTGVTNFWFTDSLINGSLKQFNDLMNQLAKHKQTINSLSNLMYTGQFIIRPKSDHPEKMFQLMNKSGCNQILVGIESGSKEVRDHMDKKFSNEDIDWHFEMCEKYKIKNWVLLITGYPTETEQDHQATLDLLIKNQRYIINHTILGLNLQYLMAILPNTPIEAMMPSLGIHHVDNSHGSYINWLSESNPSLTLSRRYQRFAEIAELAIKLRYNVSKEILYFLKKNIRHADSNTQAPILSNSAIMS
jgi:radical SAM superfamily enzyme YgiQ (UPF0313 family)